MTVRRAIVGLSAMCGILLSAFVAQGASAASQTAVTCTTTGTQVGPVKFADEHCKEANGTTGPRYHVAITEKTEFEGTNATTGGGKEPGILKATIGGLSTIIEAKTMTTSGTIENGLSGTEMYAVGESGPGKLSEVTVTNRTCEFIGVNPNGTETVGSVETRPIVGTTKGLALGVVKFEPQAGPNAEIAKFKLTGASCPEALTGTYPVFGTIVSNASEGATRSISHEAGTTAKSLRLKNATTGPLFGVAGVGTTKAGKVGTSPSTWTPMAVT